jgi:hypothetical protein
MMNDLQSDLDVPYGTHPLGLQPGQAWVLYWDNGPGGPCGQSMRTTCEHAMLVIFDSETEMRSTLSEGIGRNPTAKRMCGVVGDYTSSGVFRVLDKRGTKGE